MSAARLGAVPVLCLVWTLHGAANPAAAQDQYFEYAVKIVCGTPDRPAVAPGTYFTAINIHNPNPNPIDTVYFRKKFALTAANEQPGPVSSFSVNSLVSDRALEIDCTGVFARMRVRGFAKGFAVIQSPAALDVVAVYTAAGATDRIATMDLERVPPRMVKGTLKF